MSASATPLGRSPRALWYRASLRARLILQVCVALGVVLTAFVLVSLQALDMSTRQALDERQVVARLMAERVDTQLDAARHTLEDALADSRLGLDDDNLEPEQLWLDGIYRGANLFKRLFLLDARGVVLATAPEPTSMVGENMSAPPYNVRLAMLASPAFLPGVGVRTQKPGIQVLEPIAGPKGGISGYLLGWIDLSDPRAAPLLFPYTPGPGGYTDLVDQTGTVLMSTQPERVGQTTDHAGHFASLMVSGRTSVGSCHSCHEPEATRIDDVLAFAPLARVPWGVALRQSESEVFAAARTLTNEFWLLGLVVFVAFAAIIWMSTREFVWPLETISRACQRIAAGNLDQPVEMTGSADAVNLAESFDSMRRDLLDYRRHMEDSQQELENRVQGRTRELVMARDHLLRTNRNLGALNAVAAILSQSLNLSNTLESALGRAMDAVSADMGLVYLSDPDGGQSLAATRGVEARQIAAAAELGAERRGLAGSATASQAGDNTPARPESRHGLPPGCVQRLAAVLNVTNLLNATLHAKGETLGAICVGDRRDRPFGQDDQALLDSIATQIALAVRNARLYDALEQEEKARGDLLRQVIGAQEEERKRVARELHDETSQATTALMVGLDTVGLALTHNPSDAPARLASTRHIAAGMLQGVQRLISDLRPALLDDLGLVPAIAWYGDQRLGPSGIAVTIEQQGMDRRLPQAVETAVFRIAQEAFTNIMRHSGAARVRVSVSLSGGHLTLEVADDGQGMPADALRSEPGSRDRMGLRGMRERVNILGGELHIRTTRGTGTVVSVRIPIRG